MRDEVEFLHEGSIQSCSQIFICHFWWLLPDTPKLSNIASLQSEEEVRNGVDFLCRQTLKFISLN